MFYIFRLGGLLTQGNSNIEDKFMCFSFSIKLFGSWAFIVACVAAFCSVFVHVYDIPTLLTIYSTQDSFFNLTRYDNRF